ncbi:glycoside hydrolase family 2 protein [Paenibacillus sp. GYB006]|uniref:beta-mannosidase n=1 Tax=Paenibacillus sp. GYB006 TaxID=2994394 RepID=UPI002F96632C
MHETKVVLNKAWTFKACDEQDWENAVVPGFVHTDLLKNERIQDPFYGTNEKLVQWIDKKDWEYKTTFQVTDEILSEEHVDLIFHGLDTYADVYLNGVHILSADNMFRVWEVNVKTVLKAVDNELRIVFRSPIQEDLPKLEALGYQLPAANDQSEVGELGKKRVSIFARKAPYHYGWDWGPRFVTSGIWRDIELRAWSEDYIADAYIHQNKVSESAAALTAVLEVNVDQAGPRVIRIETDGGEWTKEVDLPAGESKLNIDFELESPKLWWSRGLGEPHMYTFKVQILDTTGSLAKAERCIKTGIRSIRLVQEADEYGTSFYFELNGVPVFAKGANHIPNDSFITEVTYERYRHEIESAALANMNMLRVWGGGIYEQDVFYDLCDEYGILVWQDFMFACSMYPGDEAFLASVRHEAADNIKRLRNHPSIALWCGNNEMDSAWAHYNENGGWGWKKDFTQEQREKIWADYEAIFHHLLPEVIEELVPGADYWPSSPIVSISNDINQHATTSSVTGDVHYWGVWHNAEPFENYNLQLGRFMSEYGFQSFPEHKSVLRYAEPSDLELTSEVMMAHQKNGDGNRLIKKYMDMYMTEPKDFPSFLYMSQVLQADAMKVAIEAHRRNRPFVMGTLYWQMNDTWPVASWAGMDYYGNWKALHYYAKRSFADEMISIDDTKPGRVDLYLLSDVLRPLEGDISIRIADFDGTLHEVQTHMVSIAGNTTGLVLSLDREELLSGRDEQRTVMVVELVRKGEVIDSQKHYFVPFKDMKLTKAQIEITEVEGSEGTKFHLKTSVLAKQVWLDSNQEGIFSDNYFDLIPGETKEVSFFARKGGEHAFELANPGELKVRSMSDFIEETQVQNQ